MDGGFEAEEEVEDMDGWKCFCWNGGGGAYDLAGSEPEPFSLPSAIPEWPKGKGFAEGSIHLGELEAVNISKFQSIWSCCVSKNKREGAIFYKPAEIPDGFFSLGDYGQPTGQPFQGFLLAVRAVANSKDTDLPPLQKPTDYALIWCSANWQQDNHDHDRSVCFWLPCPPQGYKAVGYVLTNDPNKPSVDEVRCVRADLTDSCENHESILSIQSNIPFNVWKSRPSLRGMWCKGVPAGTFCCSTDSNFNGEMGGISCLKNLDPSLPAMPNLDQVHALVKHYGPTVFFHPKETYLPSSVAWFFTNGATLHTRGDDEGQAIDALGSNLPVEGDNDGEYWIDLPDDDIGDHVKRGNLNTAELYIHVKPALGGTFTDIAMWVFCPFNGPATLKVGLLNIPLKHIGQHVGDWEHFTLRISNFSGELSGIYFSEHSGGEWVDASGLEFVEGNRAIVYSSKSGHASFAHPGTYLQGSERLGIGVRNDAARSKFYVDSSAHYQIIAAEHLGDVVSEPVWLQYMREWGPTVEYNSRSELDKILSFLPFKLRCSVENVLDKLPTELFREEGPTGPKQKDNWEGDERA